ncbi:transcription termination/antitermination protein NusG [Mycoplasma marinum]|uniref:Transcription termination/antitermination protein NusG n=1 Tax=Mycoplasma marinum TaxID=1937190 RepID=A0A4R0XVR4_9MOLU|nr:transcription termination/antitermination protein NusG [Mycoplasma marinum]TCG11875.1 transcription termination/antitermination protein NusG [Mycoplasma marinum]
MENEMKWYMVTTISGKEEKVVESLKNRVVSESLEGVISEFKIAMVPHITPSGKYKEKNMFPGYIFIKMVMTNEAWFIVRNTQYVTGLVGSSGQRTKPTPVSNLEIRRIDKSVVKAFEDYKAGKLTKPKYEIGTIIEVVEGATKGLKGPILNYDEEKKVVIVELTLFDRATPTEISIEHIEILN